MDKQFCPKCGNELKAGAKFCPKCGAQIATQSTASNGDAAMATKEFITGYFGWWLDTIKHPFARRDKQNQYFGLTSFIISAILGWILMSVIIPNFQLVINANDDVYNALKAVGLNGIASVSVPKLDMFIVIMMVLFVVIAYLAKVLFNNQKVNIYDFLNDLAGRTNTAMIWLVVIIVANLLSISADVAGVVMWLLVFNDFVGFVGSILDRNASKKLDKITIAFLAFLVFTIVTKIVFSGMIL